MLGRFWIIELKRAGVELMAGALLGDQVFVGAALDDAAMVENHDAVGVRDRGQTVGDDEDGAALHQGVHAVLHQSFSVRVSMEEVASSRIMTGGSATAARAMASSCRWPWDRLAPLPVSMVL